MPKLFRYASRARPRSRVTSRPFTKISPPSGRRIPSTDFIITDLPVPEPPITTNDLPASSFRSRPSSTTLLPKRFFTPRSSTFAVLSCFAIASIREQDVGEDVIGGEDQDRGRHNRARRRLAHALRAALGIETIVA